MDKIAIGTANFYKPYGILNRGTAIAPEDVKSIFAYMNNNGISTIDTAFSYGDLFSILCDASIVSRMNIVTKFSLLDDYDELYCKIENLHSVYGLKPFYGLLIHDPQNLSKINHIRLRTFLDRVRTFGLVKKTGVSVYDLQEIKNFHGIIPTELVQIPLNPLNQTLSCDEFKDLVAENNIEVHARSLFLQGILLSDQLPESLDSLEPMWNRFLSIVSSYSSRLQVLLSWALSQKWINKWVVGVSCLEDLEDIITQVDANENANTEDLFAELKYMFHPLTDPRNWTK